MVDTDNNLILVKGEDKTSSVLSWKFDKYKPVVFITYSNNKSYPYNIAEVLILKRRKTESLKDTIVLRRGLQLNDAVEVQYFGDYCRVLYKTGYREIVSKRELTIVRSAFCNEKSKNCFDYLKQLSIVTGLTFEGKNILADQFEKINFIREDSVLAAYLSGVYPSAEVKRAHQIVYPFGFNISQKKAVENALCSQISIIEGPPGTGKTQTILNIIANAVMRGESVAVVSGNNCATENVFEKLKKYGFDFIAAPLGNLSNKEAFIKSQNPDIPDIECQLNADAELAIMRQEEAELDSKLRLKNELSALEAEQDVVEKEYAHFRDYYNTLKFESNMPVFSKRVSADKILAFAAEYEFVSSAKNKISLFKKFYFKFKYGVKKANFYCVKTENITDFCQNLYYERRLVEIKKRKLELQPQLTAFDFDAKMKKYSELSMKAFQYSLANKYRDRKTRRYYDADDLWKNSEQFISDYPVVLSTAYSLRASLSNKFVYDYVIVDEASQVDIVTGALALSCAKKAVIVGDLKQLPNVVDKVSKVITDRIFKQYTLKDAYRYSSNSLLSSVSLLFQEAPRVLLKEHYRCHPEIIGFCNQRFYNNELIILTEPKSGNKPLAVYKTVPGNHARNHFNQRQIDVIKKEVFPDQNLSLYDGSVGIVTPYRNQADALKEAFRNSSVKADTADKFQGQERSVIIFSTVDNEIGDFVSDPNRLNVVVSRAVNKFIVVTDGNENDESSPIHELIGYIRYHNHEIINSQTYSVFDYLYKNYSEIRHATVAKYGRVSDVESENLMYGVICSVLQNDDFLKYDVVMHVPLRVILSDLKKLSTRELSFATNHLTHVDFLIFSRLTHQPVLVVEVDGFTYHSNEKQRERDHVKNTVLEKYGIPILRLSTVGSGEKEKLIEALRCKNRE